MLMLVNRDKSCSSQYSHLPKHVIQEKIISYIDYFKNSAVIPLLNSSSPYDFNKKFKDAVNQYLHIDIQLLYSLEINNTKSKQLRKQVSEMSLLMLSNTKEMLEEKKKNELRDLLITSLDRIETYFYFMADPKVKIDDIKYSPIVDLTAGIWVCLILAIEVFENKQYEYKSTQIIKKCKKLLKKYEEYLFLIASDNNRIVSDEVENIINSIK
jgi:hypothetical protein